MGSNVKKRSSQNLCFLSQKSVKKGIGGGIGKARVSGKVGSDAKRGKPSPAKRQSAEKIGLWGESLVRLEKRKRRKRHRKRKYSAAIAPKVRIRLFVLAKGNTGKRIVRGGKITPEG